MQRHLGISTVGAPERGGQASWSLVRTGGLDLVPPRARATSHRGSRPAPPETGHHTGEGAWKSTADPLLPPADLLVGPLLAKPGTAGARGLRSWGSRFPGRRAGHQPLALDSGPEGHCLCRASPL